VLAGWKPMNSAGEWSSRAVRYSLDRGPRFVGHLHDAFAVTLAEHPQAVGFPVAAVEPQDLRDPGPGGQQQQDQRSIALLGQRVAWQCRVAAALRRARRYSPGEERDHPPVLSTANPEALCASWAIHRSTGGGGRCWRRVVTDSREVRSARPGTTIMAGLAAWVLRPTGVGGAFVGWCDVCGRSALRVVRGCPGAGPCRCG
jgi:hypothetical protein